MIVPDAVETAINWLRTHPAITTLDPTVAGDLVGFQKGQRWLTVSTTGGTSVLPWRLHSVSLDLNAYAESRPMSRQLCAAAVSALWDMRNHTTDDAVVTAVDLALAPADLTDTLSHTYRFVADVSVYIRPR